MSSTGQRYCQKPRAHHVVIQGSPACTQSTSAGANHPHQVGFPPSAHKASGSPSSSSHQRRRIVSSPLTPLLQSQPQPPEQSKFVHHKPPAPTTTSPPALPEDDSTLLLRSAQQLKLAAEANACLESQVQEERAKRSFAESKAATAECVAQKKLQQLQAQWMDLLQSEREEITRLRLALKQQSVQSPSAVYMAHTGSAATAVSALGNPGAVLAAPGAGLAGITADADDAGVPNDVVTSAIPVTLEVAKTANSLHSAQEPDQQGFAASGLTDSPLSKQPQAISESNHTALHTKVPGCNTCSQLHETVLELEEEIAASQTRMNILQLSHEGQIAQTEIVIEFQESEFQHQLLRAQGKNDHLEDQLDILRAQIPDLQAKHQTEVAVLEGLCNTLEAVAVVTATKQVPIVGMNPKTAAVVKTAKQTLATADEAVTERVNQLMAQLDDLQSEEGIDKASEMALESMCDALEAVAVVTAAKQVPIVGMNPKTAAVVKTAKQTLATADEAVTERVNQTMAQLDDLQSEEGIDKASEMAFFEGMCDALEAVAVVTATKQVPIVGMNPKTAAVVKTAKQTLATADEAVTAHDDSQIVSRSVTVAETPLGRPVRSTIQTNNATKADSNPQRTETIAITPITAAGKHETPGNPLAVRPGGKEVGISSTASAELTAALGEMTGQLAQAEQEVTVLTIQLADTEQQLVQIAAEYDKQKSLMLMKQVMARWRAGDLLNVVRMWAKELAWGKWLAARFKAGSQIIEAIKKRMNHNFMKGWVMELAAAMNLEKTCEVKDTEILVQSKMKEDVKVAKHMMEINLKKQKRDLMAELQKEQTMTAQLKVALEIASEKDAKDTIVEIIEKCAEQSAKLRRELEELQETHHEIAACEAHAAETKAEQEQSRSVELGERDSAIHELTVTNETLATQVREAQTQLTEVQSKLEEESEESKRLRNQLDEELELIEGELEKLIKKDLSISSMVPEERKGALTDVFVELGASVDAIEQLVAKFGVQTAAEVQASIEACELELKEQIKAAEDQLEEKERQEEALRLQFQAVERSKVDELDTILRRTQRQLEESSEELETAKRAHEEAQEELASASTEIETLKGDTPPDALEFAAAKGKVAQLEAKATAIELRLTETVAELQAATEAHASELAPLKTELRDAQAQVVSMRNAHDEARQELANASVVVETLKAAAPPDAVELAQAKGKAAELETKQAALEHRLTYTAAELETSKQEVGVLEEKVGSLKTEAKTAKRAHDQELEALEEEFASTRSEMEYLKQMLKPVPKARGPPGGAISEEVQIMLNGIKGDSQAGAKAMLVGLQEGVRAENHFCESAALELAVQGVQAVQSGEQLSQIEAIVSQVAQRLVVCDSTHRVAAANLSTRLKKAVASHRHNWTLVSCRAVKQAVSTAATELFSITECVMDCEIAAELQQIASHLQQFGAHDAELITQLMHLTLADLEAVVKRLRCAGFEAVGLSVTRIIWSLQDNYNELVEVTGPLSVQSVVQQSGLTFTEVLANASALTDSIPPTPLPFDMWTSIGECLEGDAVTEDKSHFLQLNDSFLNLTRVSDSLGLVELRSQLQVLRGLILKLCRELGKAQQTSIGKVDACGYNFGALVLLLGSAVGSESLIIDGGDFMSIDKCVPVEITMFTVAALIAQAVAALAIIESKTQTATTQTIAEMQMQRFALETELHATSQELECVRDATQELKRVHEKAKIQMQGEINDLTMKIFTMQTEATTARVAHEQVIERIHLEGSSAQAAHEKQVVALRDELEHLKHHPGGLKQRPRRGEVLAEAMQIVEQAIKPEHVVERFGCRSRAINSIDQL